MKCTEYIVGLADPDDPLCRCPVCKGWLPRDFPLEKIFKYRKCGTELMTFPHFDEEGEPYDDWGKICPVSHSLSTKVKSIEK